MGDKVHQVLLTDLQKELKKSNLPIHNDFGATVSNYDTLEGYEEHRLFQISLLTYELCMP